MKVLKFPSKNNLDVIQERLAAIETPAPIAPAPIALTPVPDLDRAERIVLIVLGLIFLASHILYDLKFSPATGTETRATATATECSPPIP